MNFKRTKIMVSIVLILLIISVIFVMYKFVGDGAKDIKSARNFVEKLYEINAINKQEDLKNINYKRVRTVNTKNKLIYKTIIANSYGIDLDKNYNVIGFGNKEVAQVNSEITIEEAKENADKYLSKIYNGEFLFKSIKVEEDSDKLPYYSFIYLKCKDGYPFYSAEIIVNINKGTGMLENYANSSTQKECKDIVKNISQQEAEAKALDSFMKYNKNAEIGQETELAYAEPKDKAEDKLMSELCYVVVVKGKDENNVDITCEFFISTETKEIINSLKYGLEDSVISS